MYLRQYQQSSTIAAIATPAGMGAIHVLRISGPEAIHVAKKLFSGPVDQYLTHTVHRGRVLAADGSTIDDCLLILFRAPKSYTGEECVEIHCHGSLHIAQRILERIVEAGARPAMPGEFTFQAFMNGKLDLTQAEAVQELIASKSELARQAAERRLDGALSQKIRSFQQELTRIAAILNAWVDFPEEGLEFVSTEDLLEPLSSIIERMKKLLQTFHDQKPVHCTLRLCLIGAPNVGKSSLMNTLLGHDRAIVTDIPGTTRDSLEAELFFNGLHFHLIDTAGIRSSSDPIEQEGVKRAQIEMQKADLIFLILDAGRPLSEEDRTLLESVPREKTLLIWNKIDLARPPENIVWEPTIYLSAREELGIDSLKQTVQRHVFKGQAPSKEEVIISKLRHYEALQMAIDACIQVLAGIQAKQSPEFIAFEMRCALDHLGEILGTNVSEDILNSIFSQFCVGK